MQNQVKAVDLQYQSNLNKIQERHQELDSFIDKHIERHKDGKPLRMPCVIPDYGISVRRLLGLSMYFSPGMSKVYVIHKPDDI